MKCQDYKYMMLDDIRGTLSRTEKIELERHLLECPSCFQSLQKLKSGQLSGESATGLFWYLLKPSGGYKSMFLLGSLCIILFFMALVVIQFKYPLLFKF